MNGYGSSEDNQPMTWLRGYPIYAAHFIVVVFVASLIATSLLMALNVGHLLEWLSFNSERVLRGEIWRVATYGLVNPPSAKGIWFAVDMFMIVSFGREIERSFGRRTFLRLYSCLYLLTPVLFTLIGLWRPMAFSGETGAFALFIAFATLYPDAIMLFNILAKWVALILVGIYSLISLSEHNWIGLISLWSTVGFAYAFVRYQQGHLTLPSFRLRKRKPQFHVLPTVTVSKTASPKYVKEDSMAEVDALLDKIAQSGIGSLTAKERAKLDAARERLRKRTGK